MYHDFACTVRQPAFSDFAAFFLYNCLGELFRGNPDGSTPKTFGFRGVRILMDLDGGPELSQRDIVDLPQPVNEQANHVRIGITHGHSPTVLVPLSPPEGQPDQIQSNPVIARVPNSGHRAWLSPPSLKSRPTHVADAALYGQWRSTTFAPTSRATLREKVVVPDGCTPLGTILRVPCDSETVATPQHEFRTMLPRMNTPLGEVGESATPLGWARSGRVSSRQSSPGRRTVQRP